MHQNSPLGLHIDLCNLDCAAFGFVLISILIEVSKPKSYHVNISKSYDFSQNLKGLAQKLSLLRPFQFWTCKGRGSVIFCTTPSKLLSSMYLLKTNKLCFIKNSVSLILIPINLVPNFTHRGRLVIRGRCCSFSQPSAPPALWLVLLRFVQKPISAPGEARTHDPILSIRKS